MANFAKINGSGIAEGVDFEVIHCHLSRNFEGAQARLNYVCLNCGKRILPAFKFQGIVSKLRKMNVLYNGDSIPF